MGNRISPEVQELVARVVCTIRDDGVNAASRLVADLTDTQHMALTLALAWCVPADQPLKTFSPTPISDEEGMANQRALAAALVEHHLVQRLPNRHQEAA
ncbi:hypothetical protein [Streptosporangium sp. NPDC051022]|uniref:hypothetical protein n=1 Tax=Streptosporangium sp. NPDC051022 TaxID=3155752 RepID=UPI0034190D32